MNNERFFQKLAGAAAILSAPLGFASMILVLMPVDFNFEAFENYSLFLTAGPAGAGILRWSMILDVFGYYLLLVPAMFVLWQWFKDKGALKAGFYTAFGLAYALLGAAGAAVLAAAWPPLIHAYAAAGDQAGAVETVFRTLSDVVISGIWNTLDPITSGIWWLGMGGLLRSERRGLGIFTILVGVTTLTGWVGSVLGSAMLAMLGLNLYLVFALAWALWLGIDLLRKPISNSSK